MKIANVHTNTDHCLFVKRLSSFLQTHMYTYRAWFVCPCNFELCVSVSVVNLSTDTQNKLKIYQENFEKAYIESSREFYHSRASAYLAENGIVNYMIYVSEVV